jgi:hypothetical protein
MVNDKEFTLPSWLLPVLSWTIAAYFFAGVWRKASFPPTYSYEVIVIGIPALFFTFFPFFSKIKIGKIIELEREVEKAKKELADFKTEVRNTMSVLSTNVNTIGGMSNQVNITLPNIEELRKTRQDVAAAIPDKAKKEAQAVESKIIRQSGENKMTALVMTRVDLERKLREMLGRQTQVPSMRLESVKFAPLIKLWQMAVDTYPGLSNLQKGFKYVNQVCNAAVHAQDVDDAQADEALALGAEILAALESVERGDPLP